jgi:hypothetical protein
MAHDVRSPHIFIDGPGHTASGDQVMDNIDALWVEIDTKLKSSKVLYGLVTSLGAVSVAGSGGWTPARTATGVYTLTPSPVFTAVPAVVAIAGPTGGATVCSVSAVTASLITLNTFTANTGAAVDSGFLFIAIGAR